MGASGNSFPVARASEGPNANRPAGDDLQASSDIALVVGVRQVPERVLVDQRRTGGDVAERPGPLRPFAQWAAAVDCAELHLELATWRELADGPMEIVG